MAGTREDALSAFDEKRVAEREPVINLNGSLPLSNLRDETQTSGSATTTDENSEFRIHHTTAGDFGRISSAARGVYVPGTPAEVGIGIRLDTSSISGDGVAYWGYFDMQISGGSNTENIDDGILFGLDSSGFFVELIKNGSSEKKVYEENFNIAPSPGIDLTDGNIYQIEYSYYGYGLIKFQRVIAKEGAHFQEVQNLHSMRIEGDTFVEKSNLQVGALAKSSTGAGDFSIFMGGRQYSTVGKFTPRVRLNSGRRSGVSITSSSFTPILSLRRKEAFRDVATEVFGFSAITDVNAIIQVRINSTLTGASFGSLQEQPDDETSIQLDTSATAVDTSTGIKIYESSLSGGNQGSDTFLTQDQNLLVDVPDEGIITFAIQGLSNGNVEVMTAQIKERW